MSSLTLRHYTQTLANHSSQREQRLRDFKKRFRTRISRRRIRAAIKSTITKHSAIA